MRIGCTFPHGDIGNDPAAIRDFAQAAEDIGYDHIMIYDHVLGAVHAGRNPPLTGPYTEDTPFHESFVTMGYMAAVTKRIEFCTGIIILPQRQTVLAAKQAAEVQILSQGRLRLGLGTGWNYVEYEGLGMDWADRGERYEEQMTLMRRLWTEHVIDYRGKFHRIDRAGILPRPAQPIPVWLGGAHERVLKRAAKFADGFIFSRGGPKSLESAGKVREMAAAEGKDPTRFGVEGILDYADGEAKWVERFEAWRRVDATHACVRTMGEQPVSPATQIAAIRRWAAAVDVKRKG